MFVFAPILFRADFNKVSPRVDRTLQGFSLDVPSNYSDPGAISSRVIQLQEKFLKFQSTPELRFDSETQQVRIELEAENQKSKWKLRRLEQPHASKLRQPSAHQNSANEMRFKNQKGIWSTEFIELQEGENTFELEKLSAKKSFRRSFQIIAPLKKND